MELFVNDEKLDIELEGEKTVGDVLKSFEAECERQNCTTVGIILDGKTISAEEFDDASGKPLSENTKIELKVISESEIEKRFSEESVLCRETAERLKTIPALLQEGKDGEAAKILTILADLIDNICSTASLSALFPEKFADFKVDGMNFSEFFADFSPVLKELENAMTAKDSVLTGDLAEYEISPRLETLSGALEVFN